MNNAALAPVIDINTRKVIAPAAIAFELGKTYRPSGSTATAPVVIVAKRTAKTVWFIDADGYERRRKIETYTDKLGRTIEYVGLTSSYNLEAYELAA